MSSLFEQNEQKPPRGYDVHIAFFRWIFRGFLSLSFYQERSEKSCDGHRRVAQGPVLRVIESQKIGARSAFK